MHNQDVRQQGPDQPVSVVLDGYGNQIERFDDDRLQITVSKRSPIDEPIIERWYWAFVGVHGTPAADMAECNVEDGKRYQTEKSVLYAETL